MIYAIGLDTDTTFTHFLSEAYRRGFEIQPINLRALAEGEWSFAIPEDGSTSLVIDNEQIALDPEGAYFCRLIDISSVISSQSIALNWQAMIWSLASWLSNIPGLVINRPGFQCDNGSKPLHENHLLEMGFLVPSSLTSSDGVQLHQFATAGETIVKPLSGVRATSRLVTPEEFLNFDSFRGPVHLQRYIAGADIRVHVVNREVHPVLINSSGVDYRHSDTITEYKECTIPDSLSQLLIEATQKFGLCLAGWDFKFTNDGEFWCLEANPMPAYNMYDKKLDGKITASLLEVLNAA